jgi:hypothetical protein
MDWIHRLFHGELVIDTKHSNKAKKEPLRVNLFVLRKSLPREKVIGEKHDFQPP